MARGRVRRRDRPGLRTSSGRLVYGALVTTRLGRAAAGAVALLLAGLLSSCSGGDESTALRPQRHFEKRSGDVRVLDLQRKTGTNAEETVEVGKGVKEIAVRMYCARKTGRIDVRAAGFGGAAGECRRRGTSATVLLGVEPVKLGSGSTVVSITAPEGSLWSVAVDTRS
jgi:hypothetical protein